MVRRLSDAWRDLRHAVKGLAKAPSFTLTAVGTLGLAIGASAAIFTLVDAVLLEPLPYPDADRLVVLRGSAPGTDVGRKASPPSSTSSSRRTRICSKTSPRTTQFTSTLRTDERVEPRSDVESVAVAVRDARRSTAARPTCRRRRTATWRS